MKKHLYLFTLLLLFISVTAHENETIRKIEEAYKSGQLNYEQALLQKFYSGFDKDKLDKNFTITTQSAMKCATHLIAEYRNNIDKLSNETKSIIENLITPAAKRKNNSITTESYISPYEKFELTYSTTGENAVSSLDLDNSGIPDYVELVAEYFDHSWRVLIDTLGFKAIPLGNGEYYQISFENMEYYGYTDWTNTSAGTEIVMHNTYQGFPTNTDPDGNVLGAAKVTAVHEFKHAVQFLYNNWNEPGWFIEADATWSEDIGFDMTNDYYNYLRSSQISQPGRGLAEGDGYEDNLFFHFFTERYDINTNREIWERREQFNESVYSSVNNMLANYGAIFDEAFAEYYTWLYNTGNRFNENLPGFGEAEEYPTSFVCVNVSDLPSEDSGCSRDALSGNFLVYNSQSQEEFLQVLLDTPHGNNYVVVILVNNDETTSTEFYELNNTSVFDLFVQPKLSDIERVILIPVVTSTTGANFDYEYSFDTFKSAVFTHKPLIDTETTGDIAFILNLETPRNLAYIDSLKVFYQLNSATYNSIKMEPTDNQDEYAAVIPDPGIDVKVGYYFSIEDQLGDTRYYPEFAPDSIFTFLIGADNKPPVVTHSKIEESVRFDFPLTLYANFSDNIKLDSTYMEYKVNGGEIVRTDFTNLTGDLFYAVLELNEDQLNEGDLVYYKLSAVDSSTNKNKTILPDNGFYSIAVKNGFKYFSNPGIPIVEQQFSTRDAITIEDDIIIDDIKFYIKTNHTKFSELQIRLQTPGGKNIVIYDQDWLGTSLDNLVNPNITFDDNTYFTLDNIVFVDSLNASGSVQTSQKSFENLKNISALGKWTLALFDKEENGFVGDLLEWGLVMRGDYSTDVWSSPDEIPTEYSISQNYPNPFNPTTRIKYQVASNEKVSLKVYDILGKKIATLVNKIQSPGNYEVEFDASSLSSGIYFYRLTSGSFVQTRKMMLVK